MITCDASFHSCLCSEELNHDGIHKCQCGGSWDDDGEIYSFPDISLAGLVFPFGAGGVS